MDKAHLLIKRINLRIKQEIIPCNGSISSDHASHQVQEMAG
jgi:hypothetical protein